MQKIYDFEISPIKYYKNGRDNDFPEIKRCSFCKDHMIKNGFYQRFIITSRGRSYRIFIRRYRCRHCNKSVSILPSFLLPYFQRCLKAIFLCLENYFFKGNYTLKHRQVHFYVNRLKVNIPGLISFFRDILNPRLDFKSIKNKKAIKLIEMIKGSPTPTFARRYFHHFNKSFMAN